MSYENKENILQFFEGVHEKDNKAELLEVYRKAKAFDEISSVFVDSLANDYDDHSIVQNIAMVIENESGGYDAKK